MKFKKPVVIAVVVGVALLGIIIYLLRTPSKEEQDFQKEMAGSNEPGMHMENGIPVIDEDPVAHLERYKKWAQYPPNSRPLHAGQVDLLDPYNASRPAVGVLQTPAQGCEKGAGDIIKCSKPAVLSEIECKLTPESSISVGKKDFKLYLSCFNKKQNDGKALAIDSIEPKVYRILFKNQTPTLPVIASADDGQNGDAKAGDHIYTFVVRPTAQDWGDMYLEVNFKVNGLVQNQRASWFSTPQKVAEFQSGIRDANRNGQLIVSVPVQIIKAGYYKFDANLIEKDGDKQPVASASWEGDLQAGAQTVDIQFFGKVIKDKKIDGPYALTNLRGLRNNSPVTPSMLKAALVAGRAMTPQVHKEPLQEYVEPFTGEYTTAKYRAEEFSPDEWQSEEKDRRVKYLESLKEN